MNSRLLPALIAVLMVVAGACSGVGETGSDTSRRSVVTSFYPLNFIVSEVAGRRVDIDSLTPAGVEPHDLELTASQVQMVSEADLLVYIGEGFQPAVDKLVPEVPNTVDVLTVRPSGARTEDPHIWLDPVQMVAITGIVADALATVDPKSANGYRRNADALIAQLNQLDDSFSQGLSRCDHRTIVTAHESFGHLADRFNLRQVGIGGLDPEQEPSARRLDEVAEIVREAGVNTIFFEALLPEDLADTVARETGTGTAVLDPLESPPKSGDYITAMRSNLEALRAALRCR